MGQIHIYYGDGKGKTTAAIGLGVRACGSGKQVLLVQFLKGNTSNELNVLREIPNFTIMDTPPTIKFTFQMNESELNETADLCTGMLNRAIQAVHNGGYDLLILDEIFGTLNCKLLDTEAFTEFVRNKPPQLELVFNRRNPSQELIDLSDYVTEMKKIKHPYDHGIAARKGIEF